MVRIFACSRLLGPSSSLSVPRKELCNILDWNEIVDALAEKLGISGDKIFCHTDSMINIFRYKNHLEI